MEVQLDKTPETISEADSEDIDSLKSDIFKLLYMFEDFILTSYKRKFQYYRRLIDSIGTSDGVDTTLPIKKMKSPNLKIPQRSFNTNRELPKLNTSDIENWQERAEDLLKIFVLYLNKLSLLYDCYRPVYSKIYSINPKEIPEHLDGYLDVDKLAFRNGGCLRIIINILVILMDGRNNLKHLDDKSSTKESSKEIFKVFDQLTKSGSEVRRDSEVCNKNSRDCLVNKTCFEPSENSYDDFLSCVRQQACRDGSHQPSDIIKLTSTGTIRNRSHSQDSACVEYKNKASQIDLLYDIMHFVLWKNQDSYDNLISSENDEYGLKVDLDND